MGSYNQEVQLLNNSWSVFRAFVVEKVKLYLLYMFSSSHIRRTYV